MHPRIPASHIIPLPHTPINLSLIPFHLTIQRYTIRRCFQLGLVFDGGGWLPIRLHVELIDEVQLGTMLYFTPCRLDYTMSEVSEE